MEKSFCGLCKQEIDINDWGSHVRTQEHIRKEREFFGSPKSLEFIAFEYTTTKSFLEALNILCSLEKYTILLRENG